MTTFPPPDPEGWGIRLTDDGLHEPFSLDERHVVLEPQPSKWDAVAAIAEEDDRPDLLLPLAQMLGLDANGEPIKPL